MKLHKSHIFWALALSLAGGLSAHAQSAASQQIIGMYVAKAQPMFDKADAKVREQIAKEPNATRRAKLQAVFGGGVILPQDKALIIQTLASAMDRNMGPGEAEQTLTFLQSPAGQHFIAAQETINSTITPLVQRIVQSKLSQLKQ